MDARFLEHLTVTGDFQSLAKYGRDLHRDMILYSNTINHDANHDVVVLNL